MSGISDAGDTGSQSKQGWFRRLKSGLGRSSSNLQSNIASVFTGKKSVDAATLEALEEALISADMGVETSMALAESLSNTRVGKDLSEEDVRRVLAGQIAEILTPVAKPLAIDPAHRPEVVLVCGVNGTGKTTTIGKLAQQLTNDGKRVMLAAGDTFRAAAIEQLEVWGRRTDCDVIAKAPGADAAGLAFEALEKARAAGSDVLLIDTAGRLHNKSALMDELAKIVRVLKKTKSRSAASDCLGSGCDHGPERQGPGRDVPVDGAAHRPGRDQARRYGARRRGGGARSAIRLAGACGRRGRGGLRSSPVRSGEFRFSLARA